MGRCAWGQLDRLLVIKETCRVAQKGRIEFGGEIIAIFAFLSGRRAV
jgi:hypothetical protein